MSEITLRFEHNPGEHNPISGKRFTLNVDITIPGTGVTGIYGPSASGKTTLLRCIAGLIRAENAQCLVNGASWQSSGQFTPVHQRPLGYVFQHANLFDHLDVEQNLTYGFNRLPEEQRLIDFDETVNLLGLDDLLGRSMPGLSGGQRQRVAIGRALLSSPKLLLMDEPMASLDSDSKQEILPYLERLHDSLDIPVLYVSHSLDELMRIADQLLLMNDGKVTASGPLNDMLTREDLPLSTLDEASVVYEGLCTNQLDAYHLSEVSTDLGKFLLDQITTNVVFSKAHHRVRIRIAARDVSITLSPASDTSISNILPATIDAILPGSSPAKVLVKLRINQHYLLASITTRSVAQLQLKPNLRVYAQIKSVALL